jgi:proline iminopeptidase
MKTVLIVAGVILVLLVAGVIGLFWTYMNRPLYEPGMVRAGENLRAPLAPPEQQDDEHLWNVEPDIQLYHFAAGEGRSVLIVHGGPGYPYLEPWPGLDPLAGDYRFHFYDQRGCGQSTRPIDTFSSKNYNENVKTLDQALGIGAQLADIERIRRILGEEKLILVGHSFGGFLASLYAAEFPDHVEAMVLLAPANVLVMPPEDGGLFEAVRQRLPEEMQEEYDAYLKDYLSFGDIFSRSEGDLVALNQGMARYYHAAVDLPVPQQGEAGGWGVQAIYLSMGRRHDYRDALRVVEAPVLVVHGSEDVFQSEAASRAYAGAFPNAELRLIGDAGHFPFYSQPDVFAQVVGQFLSEME